MPYELEILRLYNENSGAYGSDTVYLVVTCASDYDTAEKSFAHNLCLHIRTRSGGSGGSATDLLDESARIDSFEFKMHGRDLAIFAHLNAKSMRRGMPSFDPLRRVPSGSYCSTSNGNDLQLGTRSKVIRSQHVHLLHG